MTKKQEIQLFEEKKVRTVWDDTAEKWYFSIVDVVCVLTDSKDPALYWRVLKKRLRDEGNETVTNCNAFKLTVADGKMRKTDVADQEQLFRLIQSIPSPKAEPFKQWMASARKKVSDMRSRRVIEA
jgi:prophage antirepressor-like protein